MAVPSRLAGWSLCISLTLCASAAAEERVVRVPPGGHAAAPWPECGSIADEKIERNPTYQISSADPDERWSFDQTGFGHRSPREDAANCVEVFVPSENGCSGVAVLQKVAPERAVVGSGTFMCSWNQRFELQPGAYSAGVGRLLDACRHQSHGNERVLDADPELAERPTDNGCH